MSVKLDNSQKAVVLHRGGPLLVAAVAGAGKTTSLIHRIKHLIESGRAHPDQILATTFTRRAAREMNNRLSKIGIDNVRVGTFHSICYEILRKDGTKFGGGFRIKGNYPLTKEVIVALNINQEETSITHIRNIMSWCKNWLISPNKYSVEHPRIEHFLKVNKLTVKYGEKLGETYAKLERYRRVARFLTYDDILFQCWRLLKKDKEVLAAWRKRYLHLIVDECFIGDTPILINKAGKTIPIRELVESKYSGKILTYSTKTGKVKRRRVIAWHKTPVGKPMVRIVMRRCGIRKDGRRFSPITEHVRFGRRIIICTEDHKIYTDRGWIKAGKLKPTDKVQLESCAPQVEHYNDLYKHGQKGKKVLSKLMTIKNQKGFCGNVGGRKGNGWTKRGGNGTGPSPIEAMLIARLGKEWKWNYVVTTNLRHYAKRQQRKKGEGYPTCYKIDLAKPDSKIAIEVDGGSHSWAERKRSDRKKDLFLKKNGWHVIRITNRDALRMTDDMLYELTANSPVQAEVLEVEPWLPREPYVYDISVKGTHCYYANGILAHNCQDNNLAQHSIMSLLAYPKNNIVIVGDDDQSIYGWRAANPKFMLDFEKDFNSKVIRMQNNYRSRPDIIHVANRLIANNRTRIEKRMDPTRSSIGQSVWYKEYRDVEAESMAIANDIRWRMNKDHLSPANFAILCRTNYSTEPFQKAMAKYKIPFKVVGGLSLFEYKCSRDLIGYLQYARSLKKGVEDREAFIQIINTPTRGLGSKFLEKVFINVGTEKTKKGNLIMKKAAKDCADGRAAASVNDFFNIIDKVRSMMKKKERPSTIIEYVAERTKYIKSVSHGDEDQEQFLTNKISSLVKAADQHKSTKGFLNYLEELAISGDMSEENDEEENGKLLIMTVHKSKGLEFPIVYVPCLYQEMLPHIMALSIGEIEEERRVAYVAFTRAINELHVSYPIRNGVRSQFLKEASLLKDEGPVF